MRLCGSPHLLYHLLSLSATHVPTPKQWKLSTRSWRQVCAIAHSTGTQGSPPRISRRRHMTCRVSFFCIEEMTCRISR
jgi:hypothetical protein